MTYFVILWCLCPFAGMFAASRREAIPQGFLLGLFFGPLGVIAALGVDGRYACKRCGTRINESAEICPMCHAETTLEE